MLRIEYDYLDYGQLMQAIAREMQVPVKDNRVVFPPAFGAGNYEFVKLPNGLHANIIQCTFHQDWLLNRHKTDQEYYTLRFDELTITDSLVVQIDEDTVKEKNTTKSVAYLTSSLSDWSYMGTRGTSFRGVNILFNAEWLARYLDIHNVEDVLRTYISLRVGNINTEPLDSEYKRWIQDIFEVNVENPMRVAIIQNRIMLMIERFFVHLYEKMSNAFYEVPLSRQDINRVMMIEALLTKDIFKPAPSIRELARIAAVSESKLKKDFKTVYGFAIYEYYQKARMQAARDRLLTGKFSVKEIAMELGYANISNFTIAFKKEFGILPSRLMVA